MSLKSLPAAAGLAAAFALAAALPALAVTAVATTDVNIRACGSTDCRILDVLGEGEEVEVEYCDGVWCAIDRSGADGFVHAGYLARADRDYRDDDYDDYRRGDYRDDDVYFERRAPRRYHYRYDSLFGACIGGPRARLCVYD